MSAPRPSCHAVVTDGRRVLLVLRGHPPFAGWWGLPGGAIEPGETVAEALVREVREETGIEVEPERLLAYKDAIARDGDGRLRHHYVILFFLARARSSTLRPDSDAADARWVEPPELPGLRLVPGAEDVLRLAGFWPGP